MIRNLRLTELKPGMMLGRDLFSHAGALLMEQGMVLTPDRIGQIHRWGMGFIPIHFKDEAVAAAVRKLVPGRLNEAQAASVRAFLKHGTEIKRQTLNLTYQILDNLRERKTIDRSETRRVVTKLVQEAVSNREVLATLLAVRQADNYIFNHSLNVCILAILVGHMLEFNPKQLIVLGEAALLHDVGMTVVPEEVRNKQGPLSEEEYFQIKKHPRLSVDLIGPMMAGEADLVKAILQHHEREDGSGYPEGLEDGEITFFAKILAVVDVYDAMTQARPYRSFHAPYQTVRSLLTQINHGLNQQVVQAFIAEMSLHPVGSVVRLNTDALGVVVRANRQAPLRPLLRMVRDEQGQPFAEEIFVDLGSDRNIFISEGIFDGAMITELTADHPPRTGAASP